MLLTIGIGGYVKPSNPTITFTPYTAADKAAVGTIYNTGMAWAKIPINLNIT